MLTNKLNTDTQLILPFAHTEVSLRHYLEESLDRPVSLALTTNSTSLLSARVKAGVLSVRLHRMFLCADRQVTHEIVSYLKTRRGAMPHFRKFIRDHQDQLSRKPARKTAVRTAGNVHDLLELFKEVNQIYFGGSVKAQITWGTRCPRSAVRKRTLGSYSERTNLIRINPMLDRKTVPRCYVALIVYHEMLHAVLGTPLRETRRSIHSREFRMKEKLFKDYEKAIAWERGKT